MRWQLLCKLCIWHSLALTPLSNSFSFTISLSRLFSVSLCAAPLFYIPCDCRAVFRFFSTINSLYIPKRMREREWVWWIWLFCIFDAFSFLLMLFSIKFANNTVRVASRLPFSLSFFFYVLLLLLLLFLSLCVVVQAECFVRHDDVICI